MTFIVTSFALGLAGWARRAGVDPCLYESAEFLLRSGSGNTRDTRIPGPADQFVVGHVVDEISERAPAVAFGILDLFADLPERLALPGHLERSQVPRRISGYAARIKICRTVAGGAAQARCAHA